MATGMATRCSACGTVFRVVPDQLRVSEGWVRCGRCAEVFNATESLLDLETGAPRRLNEEPPAATPRAMVQFSSARPLETPAAMPHAAEAADDDHFGRDVSPGHPAHQARAPRMPVVDDAESRFAEDAASADEASAVSGADIHAEVDTDASTEASTDFNARFRTQPRSDALAMPSFVRQAERAARWRQPRVRAGLLAVGALAGLGSVVMVMMMGQPRVFFAMSRDGLLPASISKVHPKFRTPYRSTILTGIFVALCASTMNVDQAGELTSIGTLFAFVLVCLGVVALRVIDPKRVRPFRAPGSPVIPVLGALFCLLMMAGLPLHTRRPTLCRAWPGSCRLSRPVPSRSEPVACCGGPPGSACCSQDRPLRRQPTSH